MGRNRHSYIDQALKRLLPHNVTVNPSHRPLPSIFLHPKGENNSCAIEEEDSSAVLLIYFNSFKELSTFSSLFHQRCTKSRLYRFKFGHFFPDLWGVFDIWRIFLLLFPFASSPLSSAIITTWSLKQIASRFIKDLLLFKFPFSSSLELTVTFLLKKVIKWWGSHLPWSQGHMSPCCLPFESFILAFVLCSGVSVFSRLFPCNLMWGCSLWQIKGRSVSFP